MIEVILVDENNREIGSMEKMEAHIKGELHRAVSVFIINSKGEWLLQRRAYEKYHSPCLWTNTCCSHPFPGENAESAAARRLVEEMGIKCSLKKLFHFIYKEELDNSLTEHELDFVFVGVSDEIPNPDTSEVDSWKYVSFDWLENDFNLHPESYTVWFGKIFRRVNEIISQSLFSPAPGTVRDTTF